MCRDHRLLLATSFMIFGLCPLAAAANAPWTGAVISRTLGKPLSVTSIGQGRSSLFYPNVGARQFLPPGVVARYPAGLLKHATVDIRFQIDAADRCVGAESALDESALDARLFANAPDLAALLPKLRQEALGSVATTLAGVCHQ